MQTTKKWGYETLIADNKANNYSGKILTVLPNGFASSVHFHIKKTESFYVTRGVLYLETYKTFDETVDVDKPPALILEHKYAVYPGGGLTLRSRTPHRFWTRFEVTEFIETSTHDDPKDSFRLVESGLAPLNKLDGVEFAKFFNLGHIIPNDLEHTIF